MIDASSYMVSLYAEYVRASTWTFDAVSFSVLALIGVAVILGVDSAKRLL